MSNSEKGRVPTVDEVIKAKGLDTMTPRYIIEQTINYCSDNITVNIDDMYANDVIEDVINLLIKRSHDTAMVKGWWDNERNDGELIALMHSELSEGLEALRTNAKSDKIKEFYGIEEELADILIRIFDMVGDRKYRLAQALLAKMEYNKSRPVMHGGKKF